MKTPKIPFLVALAGVIEWLAVALVFAFVFRGFIVEAFKIPTGSMAPTLRGDHYEVVCLQCGYEYDVGHMQGNRQEQAMGSECPSCGNQQKLFADVTGGDRILVYKGLYNFKDPRRWDVFVFKNPTEPHINYIKRTIGLPGETLELIDGDVFIDGKIARKPPKVQKELWMPVYDADFVPARPAAREFKNGSWKVPFVFEKGWKYDHGGATLLLDSKEESLLTYDLKTGNDLKAAYAYNPIYYNRNGEDCSDLKVKFWVDSIDEKSLIGAKIHKYGRVYTAKVDFENASMMLYGTDNTGAEKLYEKIDISNEYPQNPVMFEFDNADYRLTLKFGKYTLRYDIGESYGDIGTYSDGKPAVELLGKGELAINHLTLDRDIHYYTRNMSQHDHVRAGEGYAFTLGEDEFFACGDNSPMSADSRLWEHKGFGNNGKQYPMGVVPRDYLIGQAFFVYCLADISLSRMLRALE